MAFSSVSSSSQRRVACILSITLLIVCTSINAQCASGQCAEADGKEAPHQSHSVPGDDVTKFDLDGSGDEPVDLDGALSHSHYFEAGPPVVNGQIVSYEWKTDGGDVVCEKVACSGVKFPVGVTTVTLKVVDQTGDVASDVIVITIKAGDEATGKPTISAVEPSSGGAGGGTKVTLTGSKFFGDASVTVGGKAAANVNVVNTGSLTFTTPGGAAGDVEVVVSTSQGSSAPSTFSYTGGGGALSVKFYKDTWKNKDGSPWKAAEEVTGIAILDGVYYLSTLTGKVWKVVVDEGLTVQSACSGAQAGKDRSYYGIAANPADKAKRLVVTSNTMFWGKKGGVTWDNGKVEFVNVDGGGGCVSVGDTIVSGLPVSNHDHGVSKAAFAPDGTMYLTVGGSTNAGVPSDPLGGIDESPLSAAILEIPYLKAGFNGKVTYTSTDAVSTDVASGDVGIYSTGFRNSFGIIRHSNGIVYATDNGPNANFGAKSTGCNSQGEDANTQDTLHKTFKGSWHGHPNRNRGRNDPKECVYRGKGWTNAIAWMPSSTNGIVEYKSNIFGGQAKGDIFLTKLAWRGLPGKVSRVEIDGNGFATSTAYEVYGESGNSVIETPTGKLCMPQLKNYVVICLVPDLSGASARFALPGDLPEAARGPEVHHVFPRAGHWHGGEDVRVVGRNFSPESVVKIGGRECESTIFESETAIICEVPPGHPGTSAAFTVTSDGVTSPTYGPDYEWVGSRN